MYNLLLLAPEALQDPEIHSYLQYLGVLKKLFYDMIVEYSYLATVSWNFCSDWSPVWEGSSASYSHCSYSVEVCGAFLESSEGVVGGLGVSPEEGLSPVPVQL